MEGAQEKAERRRAKLERSELVKSPLRENDRVAKRIFSCPIVKRNFNPSHQGAALPSAISLELILEILSRRYFGGTNSEDFQFVALSRFRSVAFEGFTASFRFHTIFIYRVVQSRDFAVVITSVRYRSADIVKKRRLGIERDTRFSGSEKCQTDASRTQQPMIERPTTPFSMRFARSTKFKVVGASRA